MKNYTARAIEEIPGRDGTWKQLRVGVFCVTKSGEEQIGEYHRNYPSLLNTFFAFRWGDQDLALYSSDYTATRIMALPSCHDLGGEAPDGGGFCPVEFFVPSYVDYTISVDGGPPTRHREQMPSPEYLVARDVAVRHAPTADRTERIEDHRHEPLGPLMYHPFGFVSGCVWGDDSSWKIQYLDLSRAADGVVVRDERFGYVRLPHRVALRDAIDMSDFQSHPTDDYAFSVDITTVQRFDLRTGQRHVEAI